MRSIERRCRVALVSTAPLDKPGSMRAYADVLLQAMARHSTEVEISIVELDPLPAAGPWGRRLSTLALPFRAKRIRSIDPDVWHLLDASRAYLAPGLGKRPVIATVHDIIPWLQQEGRFAGVAGLGWAARHWWRGNARALRRINSAICDSRCTAGDVQEYFGVDASRCRIVPLPLTTAMARYSAGSSGVVREPMRLLHVGNDGFYKNRRGVLRIFAQVMEAVPEARLCMAGPSPTRMLHALARELGVADRVDWLVDPNDQCVADAYRRASVLLFPSLYEGFGWPVLEAMAFGLPVVASDAGSLPEVIGDAATCFDPADEQGMAAAVLRLLASPEAHAEAVERGLARAEAFSEVAFAARMRDAYLTAAGHRDKQAT